MHERYDDSTLITSVLRNKKITVRSRCDSDTKSDRRRLTVRSKDEEEEHLVLIVQVLASRSFDGRISLFA